MRTDETFDVLLRLRDAAPNPERALPELDHVPAPWEANIQATAECLSWRGALDNLERRHAEDELGETLYADFPVEARQVLVTAHALLARGHITADELEAKMATIRTRYG